MFACTRYEFIFFFAGNIFNHYKIYLIMICHQISSFVFISFSFSCEIYSPFQGSKDNMSVVLVVFPGAPKLSPEAQQKDTELNQAIERKINGE